MTKNCTELKNNPTPASRYPICFKGDSKIDINVVEYTETSMDRNGILVRRVDNPDVAERFSNLDLQALIAWRILFEASGALAPYAYDREVDLSGDLTYLAHQAVEMVQIRQFICGNLRKMGINAHSTCNDATMKNAIAVLCSEWAEKYSENSPGAKFGYPHSVARFGYPKPSIVRSWLLRYEPADLDGMARAIAHCFSNLARKPIS